jgi:hypothetical protein
MSNQSQDFAPLPQYVETTAKNKSWVNVTLTKIEADGTRTQTIAIAPKAK